VPDKDTPVGKLVDTPGRVVEAVRTDEELGRAVPVAVLDFESAQLLEELCRRYGRKPSEMLAMVLRDFNGDSRGAGSPDRDDRVF